MRKQNYLLFTLFWVCACTLHVFAQEDGTISGTITDKATGEPIPYVNVSVNLEDGTRGAQSDLDGKYTFLLPAGTHKINFTFVGYKSKEMEQIVTEGEEIALDLVLAEDNELLNAVVVTGSKFERPASEETVSLAVVQPGLIENNNNVEVSETIEKVPGVDVVDGQANIRGGSGYAYGAGSRVTLLMDDMPILTADAGFPNWDFLPVENIGQIEIVKGAASALYGSSAMNGIINIRTAYPGSEPVTKFSIFGALYDTPSTDLAPGEEFWWKTDSTKSTPHEAGFSFAHRQKFGQLDMVLGSYVYHAERWRQNNYSRRGRMTANFRYRVPSLTGLSIGLNTNFMLNRSASYLIWNGTGAEAYRLWEATPVINNEGLKISIDPFIEYFSESGMKHKLMGRFYKNDNKNDTGQSTLSDFFYGEYQFQKRFLDQDFTITAGLVGSLALSEAELYASDFQATNFAGYVQLDKKFFDKLNVSLGFRYESNTIGARDDNVVINDIEVQDESEAKPVFRSGINYQPFEYTFIRASFGQAYRFPTIAEKFVETTLGAVAVGPLSVPVGIFPNPNLQSETGWSAELGLKQGVQISNWKGFVDASVFVNEYSDMMEFTFGVNNELCPLLGPLDIWQDFSDINCPGINVPGNGAAGFQSLNIGNTRIFGTDVSIMGQGKLFGLPTTLLAGYTYIKPQFRDADTLSYILSSVNYDDNGSFVGVNNSTDVLKYRFRHTIKFDAQSTYKGFALGASLRYYSYMQSIDEAFNRFLPGINEWRQANNGGIAVIDMRLLYNITPNTQVSFLVKNLTNLEYSLRPSLMDAPRSFTLKFSQSFGGKKENEIPAPQL